MEQYEKNVDKIANRAANTVEKVGNGLNKLYIGCSIIFANLFFAAFCLWGVYALYTAYKLDTGGEVTNGTVIASYAGRTMIQTRANDANLKDIVVQVDWMTPYLRSEPVPAELQTTLSRVLRP